MAKKEYGDLDPSVAMRILGALDRLRDKQDEETAALIERRDTYGIRSVMRLLPGGKKD